MYNLIACLAGMGVVVGALALATGTLALLMAVLENLWERFGKLAPLAAYRIGEVASALVILAVFVAVSILLFLIGCDVAEMVGWCESCEIIP